MFESYQCPKIEISIFGFINFNGEIARLVIGLTIFKGLQNDHEERERERERERGDTNFNFRTCLSDI